MTEERGGHIEFRQVGNYRWRMRVDALLQIAALFANGFSTSYYYAFFHTAFSLLQLATVVSLAVAAPAMKRRLESMYEGKHEAALRGEEAVGRMERLTAERMMKYWVMAESSSPQFVMARSVVCTNSALLCFLSDVTLLTASVIYWHESTLRRFDNGPHIESIFYIQSAGIVVGSVAPMLRWLVVVTFKCSKKFSTLPSTKELRRKLSFNFNNKRRFFKIESYWTQTLVDWRDSVPVWEIWDNTTKLRQYYLHIPKRFVLTICIGLQILTVCLSNLFIVLSALFVTPFFLSYTRINNLVNKYCNSKHDGGEIDSNLEQYVLLLDGEVELPRGILRDICRRAKNTIETGRNNQPRHLIELLEKFIDFRGVEVEGGRGDVDDDFPNCWTLPVFTLTSIALALPSFGNDERRQRLLSSASEGLSLARLVDDIQNAGHVNIRKAAERSPEIDFERYNRFRSSKEVLEALSSKAGAAVRNFNTDENPLHWPTNVVTAYSMFGITWTILTWLREEDDDDDERLLEQISAMIADVLAASLTNLPLVITTMCHRSTIEKREESVRKAFLLLGKTEQIVQLVQKKRLSLCYDEAAYVQVKFWRPLFQQRTNVATASSPISTEH